MSDPPPAKRCPICDGEIQPYMDSGHWVYSGHGVVVTGGLPYHEFCLKHAPIYRELKDIKDELERLKRSAR